MRIEIVSPTAKLLEEIADPSLIQLDVAQTVALVHQYGQTGAVDWEKVGLAAIERWSPAGWTRIKRLARSGTCWDAE